MTNGQLLNQGTVLSSKHPVHRFQIVHVDVATERVLRELRHDFELSLKRSQPVAEVDSHGFFKDGGHLVEDNVGEFVLEEGTCCLHVVTL